MDELWDVFLSGQCGVHNKFSEKSPLKRPHTMPIRARYGVSFVDSNSYLYHISVPVVLYVISCYIGQL